MANLSGAMAHFTKGSSRMGLWKDTEQNSFRMEVSLLESSKRTNYLAKEFTCIKMGNTRVSLLIIRGKDWGHSSTQMEEYMLGSLGMILSKEEGRCLSHQGK